MTNQLCICAFHNLCISLLQSTNTCVPFNTCIYSCMCVLGAWNIYYFFLELVFSCNYMTIFVTVIHVGRLTSEVYTFHQCLIVKYLLCNGVLLMSVHFIPTCFYCNLGLSNVRNCPNSLKSISQKIKQQLEMTHIIVTVLAPIITS